MRTCENFLNEYKKIIELLKATSEDLKKFMNDQKEFKNDLWQIIRSNNEQNKKELIETLGENQYKRIEKIIKSEHEDYYALDYFRTAKIDTELRKILLDKIYNNTVIENNFIQLEKEIAKTFERKKLLSIVNGLQIITDFCVSYNRSGEYLSQSYSSNYDLDINICANLGKIFDNNKLLLKINYLTRITEQLLKKTKS